MKQARFQASNDSTAVVRVTTGGRGFLLVPALISGPYQSQAVPRTFTGRPGDYPVTVTLDNDPGAPIEVWGPHAHYLHDPFPGFTISGLEPGSVWEVYLFADEREGISRNARPTVVTYSHTDFASIVDVATPPASYTVGGFPAGSQGVHLTSGMRALTFLFKGTPSLVTLWALNAAGTYWIQAGTIDPATEPVASRQVVAPYSWLVMTAASPGLTVAIDVTVEVG